MKRLFTTREVAEMWNVSPSTIKRWADAGNLQCRRTPGGHRKFSARDISEFQSRQGFEATGLLSTEDWEDPKTELAVNQKRFGKLRREVFNLAIRNQRQKVTQVLERLHIRGLELFELYDKIVMPILKLDPDSESGDVSAGHSRLLLNNLDEAVCGIFPNMLRRPPNGKIALCAGSASPCSLHVNALSRVLELEGWDAYNLGDNVTFETLAEMVGLEPVDLVCVTGTGLADAEASARSYQVLPEVTRPYRIPILLNGDAFASAQVRKNFPESSYVKSYRSLRRRAIRLSNEK